MKEALNYDANLGNTVAVRKHLNGARCGAQNGVSYPAEISKEAEVTAEVVKVASGRVNQANPRTLVVQPTFQHVRSVHIDGPRGWLELIVGNKE